MADTLEAEVKCRSCGAHRWVRWHWRHDGTDTLAEHHTDVRCPTCATGRDKTEFTGRHRGQIEIKNP